MQQRRNAGRTPVRSWLLACCAAFGLLLACQPIGPEATFEHYLNRLGAALSINTQNHQPGRVMPPPPVDAMQLGVPASGLEGVDFMAVSGCAVQDNILRRDTSLARMAKPSQQLLLTLEYLHLAPPCIERLRDSQQDALADLLQDAWRQQQAQLPALLFNATLGGDEYHAFWRAVPAPGEYPRTSRRDVAAALDAINTQVRRWLGGDYRAQQRDFELLLGTVAGGDGGRQWQALSRQGEWLETANLMLARRMASDPLCRFTARKATIPDQLTGLHTDFSDELQPLVTESIRRYLELRQPIDALESQLAAVLPVTYRHWMDDRNQRFSTIADAPRRQLAQLDHIKQACATH